MAKHFGCQFIETSAKSRLNVEEAFYNTVREIRRYNRNMNSYTADQQYTSDKQANGSYSQMQMDRDEKDTGCCGRWHAARTAPSSRRWNWIAVGRSR